MVSSRNKGEDIHREARELINRVNDQCEQEAVESDFAYLPCR
jgi:hypothetical protein